VIRVALTSAISRLESPAYGKVSISTLKKIAGALDCDLKIELLPKKVSDGSESSEERYIFPCIHGISHQRA
jgi:transcriptional regulator with XRE-family HTH domain